MACIILENGLESTLHKNLIEKYGQDIADKKMVMFQSENFLKDFGDYTKLMKEQSDLIPKEFSGRLNDKFEPELFEDNNGTYYLDNQFEKQYLDVAESELYNILKSQRAVNSLVELLANNYIEKGGFNIDFDTLDMSDNESKVSLLEAVKMRLEELGDILLESDNVDLLNNGGALYQILDSKQAIDEVISKIKDFYKARQLNYDEEFENQDVDSEVLGQRDPLFSRASFEVNPKKKVSAMVKIRLSLIKNPNELDEDFGQPKSIDYGNLYNKITAILKDNPVTIKDGKVEDIFETIINKLYEHSNNVKYLSNIAEYLEKINNLDVNLSTSNGINIHNFKAGFVNAMNLQKNSFDTSNVSATEVEVVPAVTEPVVYDNGAVGKKVIKEAIKDFEYLYEKFDASKDTKIEKTVLTNWSLSLIEYLGLIDENKGVIADNKKETFKTIKDNLKILSENKKFNNQQKAENIVDKLLPKVGININKESFNYAMNDLKNEKIDDARLDKNYYNFIDNTIKSFDSIITNHQNNNDLFNTYTYKQIAKAEAFYREDGSESSTHTAGITRYNYSNPSYLHNQINAWKKDRDLLVQEYENRNAWERNSELYDYLLGNDITNNPDLQLSTSLERIDKFKIGHFTSFKDGANKRSKQKDNKSISINEYVKDTINSLLYSKTNPKEVGDTYTRTTTAPGKSTQYNIKHQMFKDSGFNYINGVYDISTTTNFIFDKYLTAEFLRMDEQYKFLEKGKNLKVYYHTNNKGISLDSNGKLVGNAFKSQLFPELSFDKISNNIKIYENKPLYNPSGSIILENVSFYKKDLLNYIENKILQHVEDLKSDLIKYNIIEKSGENTYVNRGIDSRVIKNYTKGTFNLDEQSLFELLGDLWLNGLVNHIEYSKVFSGDIAYYKDSVDYIKRIGSSYSDGTYEYLSDVNKNFKIGVVESVEYQEPFLNELKEVIKDDESLLKSWEELINAADAQAWITPQRWKSIMLGVGKYTPQMHTVYLKMTGKNNEALTKDELKLVAQPLKGTYFYRDEKGSPIFLKYSQAVLLPQLRNNTKLKDIFDLMSHNKVDELLTFDAIKAGAITPTKIHTSEGGVEVRDNDGNFKELNTIILDSRGWKLQQDLPVKTFKETDIGSQILKNMLLLVADKFKSKESIFTHKNQKYTPEEFAKLLDSTLGSLVIKGYDDLVKEFDIDENGVIGNIDKFYNTLADELVSRDASGEIIKAVRAKLSIYGLPGLKTKLDNIFASIVNDRTVKIKTNGGSFIQMSAFGLSKEEADSDNINIKWSPKVKLGETVKPYTYKKNPDGTNATNIFGENIIQPEEILVSGSFISKYIPDYETKTSEKLFGTLNEETGELEGGLIDNQILENIIGYRIPNQGASSNGALKIVGILPASMGDTIVAFTGITKKTGSDFDIDKMYVMFPNYSPNFDKKSKLYKYVKNNLKGKTINDTIENVEKVINQINPNYEGEFNIEDFVNDIFSIESVDNTKDLQLDLLKDTYSDFVDVILSSKSKSPLYQYIVEEAGLKEIVNLRYVDSEGNSKKAIQNKVIELYKSLILHQSNISKIMTPLDHEFIKQDAQNLAPANPKSDLDNFEFVQDIQTKYSFLAGLAGVGQEANTSSDYAMGTLSNVYLNNVIVGNRAHIGEEFPVIKNGENGEYTEMEFHTKFDEIVSVKLRTGELEQWVVSYNKQAKKHNLESIDIKSIKDYNSFPISSSISALMNAFVDIAKDPYITNINWNMMTTNTGNMLLRAGVHPFVVTSFLAQPIINEYIQFVSQYETKDKSEQTTDSKNAFRIYKVGELIKEDLVHIANFDNGEQALINARTLYEVVTAYAFDLEHLEPKDFYTKAKLKAISKKIGLPEDHKFTQEDFVRIETAAKSILRKHQIFFKESFKDFVINDNLGDLRDNVFKYNLDFQSRTFNTFLVFQSYAKKLKASIDASKHSVDGIGKNTTSLLIAQNKIANIEGKGVINYNTKMYYEDGTPKLLSYYKQYNLDKTQKIVQNNPLLFVSSTEFVWNSYNQISKDIYGINLEDDKEGGLGEKLDKTFNTYLMSGFEPFNLSNEEKRNLIEEFPNEFITFKNKYEKNYKILQELNIKRTQERLYIISTNKNNSKEYTDNMINSWRDIIKYYPEFGTKLVQYSFLTSGFNNNTVGFFQFIPPSFFFQNNFNGYIKEFTKHPNTVDNNFVNHFYLSNLEDSQIVKFVNSNMKIQKQPYLDNGVTLFNNKVTKEFINVKDIFYKRIGQRINNGETENMYTTYIKVEGGYAKIKPIKSEKDRGVTIYNFNGQELTLPIDNKLTDESIAFIESMYLETNEFSNITEQEDELEQTEEVIKEKLTDLNQFEQLNLPKQFEQIVQEFTPEKINNLPPNSIFVFGSNTEGRHGKGAALTAKTKFGATQGKSKGLQGQSYAIITKDLTKGERSVSLKSIQNQLVDLMIFASNNSDKKFYVTKLGSSLAGFTIDEIKNIFIEIEDTPAGIPNNIILPKEYEVRNIQKQQLNLFEEMGENNLNTVESIYEKYKDKLDNISLEDLKLIEVRMGTEYTIEYIKKCK